MSPVAAFARLPPPVRATLLMAVAVAFFSMMSVFIRLASHHVHILEVVFFRNFLAVVLMIPWIMNQGVSALRTSRFHLYGLRAAINLVAMSAGFTAIAMIPLAEATALGFTAPLFTTIGAVLVLGEVIRARRIVALAAGFIGMLIVLRPGMEAISFGAMLALGNAVGMSMTALVVKKLTATERPEAIVLWMVLLQSPLSLIPALFYWSWPDVTTWVYLFCIAGAGTVGHVFWTRACGLAEVSQLQPLEFLKLPVIATLGYFLFNEEPSLWIWLGGAVIFSSTAYISHREAVAARRKAREDAAAA